MIDRHDVTTATRLAVARAMVLHIDELDLSVRSHSCLRRLNITHVSELVRKNRRDLLALRNMGRKSLREIESVLQCVGLRLDMRDSDIADALELPDAKQVRDSSAFIGGIDLLKSNGVDDVGTRVSRTSDAAARAMALHIDELDLSVRSYNCLRRLNITHVSELVRKNRKDLLALRNMGRKSLHEIESVLQRNGLRLGMRDTDIADALELPDAEQIRDISAFIGAMDILKSNGVDDVGMLVSRTSDEVLAVPGMDPSILNVVEKGLQKWGLRLGMPDLNRSTIDDSCGAGNEEATSDEPSIGEIQLEGVRTFKDELLHCVTRLLSKRPCLPSCFIAYHGVVDSMRLTLQDIADAGPRYGFKRTVTRERVRQVLIKAERKLRKTAPRVRFALWQPAVEEVRSSLPSSIRTFVVPFGYESARKPESIYKTLAHCADIFKLEFPFEIRKLDGVGVLVIDSADDTTAAALARLGKTDFRPYAELAEVAREIGCERDLLQTVIEASPHLEFLDATRRYFWKRPHLPPRDFCVTGNPILTSLCKVFSVTTRAGVSDLVCSIPRDRISRMNRPIQNIPNAVLEGIAVRSGLFEVHDGEIRRMEDLEWCSIGRRDFALLKICAEHGRIVSSSVIYSRLVHQGLTRENASATVAYSPFLVHSQSGVGNKEGIYKFLPRPEEIDLDALHARIAADSGGVDVEHGEAVSDVCLRIPVSSRTRLSGRHVASDPIELSGVWRVQDASGADIGNVTILDRVVDGLGPVIAALGLERDDFLELRPAVSSRVLVVGP